VTNYEEEEKENKKGKEERRGERVPAARYAKL
jgi:hypothetical protein